MSYAPFKREYTTPASKVNSNEKTNVLGPESFSTKRQTINAFLHTLLSGVSDSAETNTHSICHSLLLDSEIIERRCECRADTISL